MQIIQKIREKGAAIVIAVIALSLIGFILMDANLGMSRNAASGRASIGEINGKPVETFEFEKTVKGLEAKYNGQMNSNMLRQSAWDQLIFEHVMEGEYEKLGLGFSPKELTSIILSDDAPQELKQAFSDPATGAYDLAKAQQWWAAAKKFKGEQKEAVETQVVEPVRMQSMLSKYRSLIAASAYYPSWMKEKDAAESKAFSVISYVNVPYNVINDSLVKVSDQDIMDYISKRKSIYKQDGGRQIAYVSFSTSPNAADTAKTLESLVSLKAPFAADTNAKAFVSRNMSNRPFQDAYTVKSKLPAAQKDSLAQLSTGSIYGPYLEGGDFVLAKMLGSRQLADSVKCRHILISTQVDQQTGAPKISDSAAKKRIDSIQLAISTGADFNEMVVKYSDDAGSKEKKGEYDFSSSQFSTLAREFSETIFYGNAGDKKVVKTLFGYHYIEVLSQKNFETAYQIAYLSKEISASEETINEASAKASRLSAEARNLKALDEYVKKNGLQKIDPQVTVKEADYAVGALQDARQLIRWAFEAKEGEVSEPFSVGNDQFVVGAVTRIVPEGLPDAKTARPQVEYAVRNQKKAEMIKAKLTATPTLESAAAAYNVSTGTAGADSSLVFSASIINGIGDEPKVVGAAFNTAFQSKPSGPIAGNNGVYVVKVNSIGSKPADAADVLERNAKEKARSLAQQVGFSWYEALRKSAEIKDERGKVY